nr:uncharacterized protein LOC127329166 [Lolium perenne]
MCFDLVLSEDINFVLELDRATIPFPVPNTLTIPFPVPNTRTPNVLRQPPPPQKLDCLQPGVFSASRNGRASPYALALTALLVASASLLALIAFGVFSLPVSAPTNLATTGDTETTGSGTADAADGSSSRHARGRRDLSEGLGERGAQWTDVVSLESRAFFYHNFLLKYYLGLQSRILELIHYSENKAPAAKLLKGNLRTYRYCDSVWTFNLQPERHDVQDQGPFTGGVSRRR